MTVEECFEQWWTPKELPEGGFNKTAMLDFAETYHKEVLQQLWIRENVCKTFVPDMSTTGAAKCRLCGKQKWRH
jgi:hypothetical protein